MSSPCLRLPSSIDDGSGSAAAAGSGSLSTCTPVSGYNSGVGAVPITTSISAPSPLTFTQQNQGSDLQPHVLGGGRQGVVSSTAPAAVFPQEQLFFPITPLNMNVMISVMAVLPSNGGGANV